MKHYERSGRTIFQLECETEEAMMRIYSQNCAFFEMGGLDWQVEQNMLYYTQMQGKQINVCRQRTSAFPRLHNFFIRTNLVEEQQVGDEARQVLQMVPVHDDENVHSDYVSFDPPHFLPVTQQEVAEVEVRLEDKSGAPVAFQSGTSVLRLCFRRRL